MANDNLSPLAVFVYDVSLAITKLDDGWSLVRSSLEAVFDAQDGQMTVSFELYLASRQVDVSITTSPNNAKEGKLEYLLIINFVHEALEGERISQMFDEYNNKWDKDEDKLELSIEADDLDELFEEAFEAYLPIRDFLDQADMLSEKQDAELADLFDHFDKWDS